MRLVHDPDNRTLLHIWRTGTAFEYTNRYPLYMEWNNLKFSSLPYPDKPPYLYHVELRKPLPYPDNTFDIVYCNHVFEHLTPEDGTKLTNELHRVLKHAGICRVVVPDLEATTREYLQKLENVLQQPSTNNIIQYEWAAADHFDQMVRLKSGGVMAEKLVAGEVDWEHIKRRSGDVFDRMQINQKKNLAENIKGRFQTHRPKSINEVPEFITKIWYRLVREIYFGFSKKSRVELYNEKNLWMYDRFSLPRLFEKTNFKNIKVMDYNKSSIAGWSRYNFDQSEKGDYPLEPSLYVEGVKG